MSNRSVCLAALAMAIACLSVRPGLSGAQSLVVSGTSAADSQPVAETINIDLNGEAKPFPHFWERIFGSGRAILSLRDSYRRDLDDVKGITGFQYVRFHAILHDEAGLYSEDHTGKPIYNFSYVDQIYDGLLE
ncbi:MAG TPA: hypothetical protein VJX67_18090, partial [Blastocatellia bacterium]|nr:hypothetical protein [Blastocatellia bacterium]